MNYNKRIPIIFNILSKSNKYMTSENIGKILNVSPRTIKYDMKLLENYAKDMGALLISKRGYGYMLKIFDQKTFIDQSFFNDVNVYFSESKTDILKSNRTLDILQYLIVKEKTILTIDDLIDKFYISETVVIRELKKSEKFFSFFQIYKVEYPNHGFRFEGDELNRRICMLTLYGLYFHKVNYRSNIKEFNNFFFEGLDDVKIIRKELIHILEKHKYKISDGNIQYISRYINLAKNRVNINININFNSRRNKILKEFPNSEIITKEIAEKLKFNTLSTSERECIQILLIIFQEFEGQISYENLDNKILRKIFESFRDIIFKVNEIFGNNNIFNEEDISNLIKIFYSIIIKEILNVEFIDNNFGVDKSSSFLELNPLENNTIIAFSYFLYEEIKIKLYKDFIISFSEEDENRILKLINNYISTKEYRKRKINISIVGLNYLNAEKIKDEILKFLNPNLFNRIDINPLYRGRFQNKDRYDLFIIDESLRVFYEYNWPKIVVNMKDMDELYRNLIKEIDKLSVNHEENVDKLFKNIKIENKIVQLKDINIEKYRKIKNNLYIKYNYSNINKIIVNTLKNEEKYFFIDINMILKDIDSIRYLDHILSYNLN